jgi:hypothetical protein
MNTGDPVSEAAALPMLFRALSIGGVIIMDEYGFENFEIYDPMFRSIGIEPFWLPSGQCVISKI